ncbi:hypothetical protein F5Y03DRAFT_402980 [Xylaria venustula]|nr:hypothetical protein F5Y03DRAFT_402980 [Xylaria venustula]
MAPAQFDITPKKQASFFRYLYYQITFGPQLVSDVALSGHTALVTGSNCGIGLETSRQLLELGVSKLILAVRNEEKGKAADRKGLPADAIERIVNTSTGHGEIIQVNYLSTAMLAILLLPITKGVRANQPKPTRITLTLSEVAAWVSFPVGREVPILPALDAPGKAADNTRDRMLVSKLLGQYFITALAARVPSSVAVIDGVSPGAVHDTQFNRDFEGTLGLGLVKAIQRWVAFSSAVGARLVTDAAVRHGDEAHGQFLSMQKIAPVIYTEEGKKTSEQLWEETIEELSFAGVENIVKELGDKD